MSTEQKGINPTAISFPCTHDTVDGISVRDHIAIQVAASMLSGSMENEKFFQEYARRAYAMADALIEQSKK